MSAPRTIRVGKRGTVVLPADLRRAYDLDEEALLIVEPHPQGLLLRPAVAVPVVPSARGAARLLAASRRPSDAREAG